MKLNPNWLDQLSAASRKSPAETPEPLPRTEARVLSALREQHALPFAGKVAGAGIAACTLMIGTVAIWSDDPALPEVSAAALADLEAAEWEAPSDALLAEASLASNNDLMREINQLLHQP